MVSLATKKVIAITGSRHFDDKGIVQNIFDNYKPTQVIVGGKMGADLLALEVAKKRGVQVTLVPIQWGSGGRKEVIGIRNQKILRLKPVMVIVLLSRVADCIKTDDLVDRAKGAGVPVRQYIQ